MVLTDGSFADVRKMIYYKYGLGSVAKKSSAVVDTGALVVLTSVCTKVVWQLKVQMTPQEYKRWLVMKAVTTTEELPIAHGKGTKHIGP